MCLPFGRKKKQQVYDYHPQPAMGSAAKHYNYGYPKKYKKHRKYGHVGDGVGSMAGFWADGGFGGSDGGGSGGCSGGDGGGGGGCS
jgi:hypothetical protein